MKQRPFSIVLSLLRRHRGQFWIALAATTASQLINVPLPLLTRTMIHKVGREGLHPGHSDYSADQLLWVFAAVLVGLALVRAFLRWQQISRGERLAQGVLADVRGMMYGHIQQLSLGYFDRHPAGRVLIRFIGDANALRAWLSRTVIGVPADVMTVFCIAIALGWIHEEILAASLLPLAALVPALIWINPKARLWTRRSRRRQSILCNSLNHRLTCLPAIKSACATDFDQASIQNCIGNIAAANISRARIDAWSQSLSTGAATASLAAVGIWGTQLFLQGQLSQADLLACVWLTLMFRSPITRLAGANVIHQRARVAVERIGVLLRRPVEPGWSESLPEYKGPGRRVQFRRISYRGQDGRWLLRDFHATLRGPGLFTIADDGLHLGRIVLELLMRLRRPHKGHIRIDRQDTRKLNVGSIRRTMGWLDRDRRIVDVVSFAKGTEQWPDIVERIKSVWPQTRTIAPAASLDECMRAIHALAGRSWNEVRLDRGSRLRFAICCCLLQSPAILLMDNPTRDLDDAEAEQFVQWLSEASRSRLILILTADRRVRNIAMEELRVSLPPDGIEEELTRGSDMQAAAISAA